MAIDESLLAPISPDSPAGPSVRYEPVFDQIREARRADDDLPQGPWQRSRKNQDLDKIIRLTSETLTTRSKDLQLAAWWTEAMLKRVGLPGLTDGLTLARELIERFWDGLHPDIEEDGDLELRAAPLSWMGTKLADSVRQLSLTQDRLDWYSYKQSRSAQQQDGRVSLEQFDTAVSATGTWFYESLAHDLAAAIEATDALEAACLSRFSYAEQPDLSELKQALRDVMTLTAEVLDKRRPETPQESSETLASTETVSSPASSDVVLTHAAALRGVSPTSALPYLLVRVMQWGDLHGTTTPAGPLASPTAEMRARLEDAHAGGRWQDLLSSVEAAMMTPCGRGWLDLQRYACGACDGLGAAFADVRTAIVLQTRALLARFPELPSSALSDGSAAADRATRDWLRDVVGRGSADAFDAADKPESGRTRYQSRLQLAQDCLADGQTSVAIGILEGLIDETGQRQLESWESADFLVGAFITLFESTTDIDQRRALFARICRLHPEAARARKLEFNG